MEKNRNMEVKAPFGPRIAKTDMPKNLIDRINKFIDEVVQNNVLNKLYDHGKNLAGQVSQEIFLPDEIINGGLSNFLFEATKIYVNGVAKKEIKKFEIAKVWVVRQFKGEYNPIHWHGGHISGVGYLKLPNTFGDTIQSNKKDNPNGTINFLHGTRQFLSSSIYQKIPEVGHFYLFPNYLMHTVYPFNEEGERRSISFNAKIDSEIYDVYLN